MIVHYNITIIVLTQKDNINLWKYCSRKGKYMNEIEKTSLPIDRKLALTIKEAAEYSNIGINKINSLLRSPNCPFVLFVGTKKLVKRKEFEEFVGRKLVI